MGNPKRQLTDEECGPHVTRTYNYFDRRQRTEERAVSKEILAGARKKKPYCREICQLEEVVRR